MTAFVVIERRAESPMVPLSLFSSATFASANGLTSLSTGLAALRALQASVVNGPRFVGKTKHYGAVAAGKTADILILDQHPLIDIAATRKIHGIILKKRNFDRAALDEMQKNAREQAAKWARRLSIGRHTS